jgi:two-component sensor histidine kinase
MLKLTFLGMLVFLTMRSIAQPNPDQSSSLMISALVKSKPDTNRINLLFQLSEFYLNNSDEDKIDYDSSLFYLHEAIRLADTIHNEKWRHEAYLRLGKYYFIMKDKKNGVANFYKVINELEAAGNKKTELSVWEELLDLIPARDTSGITRIDCLKKIASLYEQLGDKENQIDALKDIADRNLNLGHFDSAEAELFDVLRRYKAINYPHLQFTYDLLAVTYRYKGDFDKAVYYALKTVESMEASHDSAAAITFYSRLANIYRELDDPENSLTWYWKVFRNRKYTGPVNSYMFRDAGFLARALIKLGRNKEALEFILDIERQNKPIGPYAKASLAGTLAFCYQALHKSDLAEGYYLNMISFTNELEKDNEVTADVNYEAGQYFLDNRQFAKASFHFQKALDVSQGINSLSTIKDIQLKLYTADSAQGNYLSAINHLRKYQSLSDSILNVTKSRQIKELQVQYETSQKEAYIKLLNNENQIEQIQVEQANRTRNITLAGTALLLIIVGLLYNSFRVKQRSNKKLEVQQGAIEEQNLSLRHLIKEKDWLVKEIHHRVKNNLQTVTSLLGTQSTYLKNEAAITAISESQHRVHAMSLIHQKLYQTENLSTVNIHDYIHELVGYLNDSYNANNHVRLDLEVERVHLDFAHCIPLGLILNEAITNSFKYAFPNDRQGIIYISFKNISENIFLLAIKDNGIGLPIGFNSAGSDSMGMNLMRGLSSEIGAQFTVSNQNGTQIEIRFDYHPDFAIEIS